MRYSLVSRFRGTLIGALLGEKPNQEREVCSAAVASCESLIALGRFDFEDWSVRQHELVLNQSTYQVLETAIWATLPLALFFHENPIKLRHYLLELSRIWRDDLIVRDSILAISYAVVRSLTEQLTRLTLIPELVSFIGETKTHLPQKLLKVNASLEQGSSLQRLKNELGNEKTLSNLVAIGFYCFLATLEDFRLSIQLSQQNREYSPTSAIIGAIAGALSGAYNSTAGIPIPTLVESQKSAQPMPNDFSRMLKSADGLLATWSGLYELKPPKNAADDNTYTLFDEKLALREAAYPLYVHTSPRVIKFR